MIDERLQFVARRLAGEPMAELCREFGISRKTGYKIFDRYQECGLEGLTDTSTWRLECSNRSRIRSAQNCHLCDRYILLPLSPGQTQGTWRRDRDSNPGYLAVYTLSKRAP